MGLKDHLEDGTGHILSLDLDLDYLYVEGAERQGSPRTAVDAGNAGVSQLRARSLGLNSKSSGASCAAHLSSSSSSSCSNLSDEATVSDSEYERMQNGSGSRSQHPCPDHLQTQQQRASSVDQFVGLDLTHTETSASIQPVTDCRTKVDFALKLGYSEELVLTVLRNLGTGALINDILGELVKLGTKTEQQGSLPPFQSPSKSFSLSSLPCSSSGASMGSCRLLCPSQLLEDKETLRPVVVDGSNVAMSHGNKEVFSCQGILLAVDWFLERGHRDITVFVPAWRKEQSRPDALITEQDLLRRLEKEKILVFTPSRRVQGRRVVCYDDRFIVKLAYESDGIIVSNDNYRDLANEKPEWKKFIDERLLMYSFVNDKFMPPDDPLGRHGPSLENFLRKKPIVHRKPPCPYGKKCTYGHKCKFYHPERGSQPQRAVADELRASASAKSSSVTSRGLVEDALMMKNQSPGHGSSIHEVESNQGTPKKQPNTSPHSSLGDLLDDGLHVQFKVDGRRGSNSSSSSSSSSTGSCWGNHRGHPVPGAHSSLGNLERWEFPGGNSARNSRNVVTSGPSQTNTPHRCQSPDVGYSSMVKAYSSLSLVVPQSPECFFPSDLRAGSRLSDCSSEGSISSDSFSPDPFLDDAPKHHHHHHHHHPPPPPPHHHHDHYYTTQFTHSTSRAPPGFSQHVPGGYTSSLGLHRQHGLGLEDHPASITSPHSFQASSAYNTAHLCYPSRSSFPGDVPARPQSQPQTPPGYTQGTSLCRNLMSSLRQERGHQDSRVCAGTSFTSKGNYTEISQQPLQRTNRESQYQQTCYDPFDSRSRTWQTHSSPHRLQASGFPPLPQLSLTPINSHKSNLPSVSQHQESPTLGQYQSLRERDRMFVNLCGIFPQDLVREVMARNPHMKDAQELAAAILLEKSYPRS